MVDRAIRAFRSRNYRLFFIGQGISLVGNWLTDVAMSWMVYRLTRDGQSGSAALWLGLVGFSEQMPILVLSPLAGVFADRWNRRKIIVVTNIFSMFQSIVLAVLSFTHLISIPQLIGLSVFQGIISSFEMPARQAFLVEIVEHREDLINAIALNSSMFNGARLVGPAIAGVLIAAVGEAYCFTLDAISYLAVIGSLLAMTIVRTPPASKRMSPIGQFKEGLAYAFGSPPILTTLAYVGWISFMTASMMTLMPIFADQISGAGHGARTLGFLMAAIGVGALFGGAYLATRKTVVGIGKVMVCAALLLGTALIAFTLGSSFWWCEACLLAGGFGMILVMASANTFLQSVVPDKTRGRVMSLYGTAVMGMAPLGSLLAGWLATRIGEPLTLIAAGGCCLTAGGVFAALLPSLQKYVRPMYLERGIIAPVVPETIVLDGKGQ